MNQTLHALAAGFPAKADTDWRALAEKALRGADFDATLGRTTADGIARGGTMFTRPESSGAVDTRDKDLFLPWGMRQTLVEATPDKANAAALDDLMGGVSELELRLDPNGQTSLKAIDIDDMDAALTGVDLSIAPVHLDAILGQGTHAHTLLALYARRRIDGEGLKGGLGINPIGRAARQGVTLDPECFNKAKDLVDLAQAAFPQLTIFRADGALAFEAGASEAQELAIMAASIAAYMRLMGETGMDASAAARAIEIRLSADADIHLTMAKLRAARRIFARIVSRFGADGEALRADIHAVTAGRMLSAQDPWTNLIRNACAGFAAASGGADAITIRPLTDAIGRPSGLARRVARNLHILLAEESHIGKVTDPAAGSYLHETLTEKLAQSAWALFQEIERRGGLAAAFADGWLQGEIAKAREAKLKRIAEGEEIILGVTQYPDPDPRAVETTGSWPHVDEPEAALKPVFLAAQFEGAE
ncbi:methylmalonyl-CoA mutase family protein [Maricaulis sp.]|uniref:methylmalonyl-CoA mutase family protein n=1 Tax=Maricaulis sp. TaxID=1486257 RepID=UPI00261510B4|nr:methylmalonyl-CoA mutase family protein [Maricaulis sp.]